MNYHIAPSSKRRRLGVSQCTNHNGRSNQSNVVSVAAIQPPPPLQPIDYQSASLPPPQRQHYVQQQQTQNPRKASVWLQPDLLLGWKVKEKWIERGGNDLGLKWNGMNVIFWERRLCGEFWILWWVSQGERTGTYDGFMFMDIRWNGYQDMDHMQLLTVFRSRLRHIWSFKNASVWPLFDSRLSPRTVFCSFEHQFYFWEYVSHIH